MELFSMLTEEKYKIMSVVVAYVKCYNYVDCATIS